jgi:7-carboxy-7-deazaguanine synthase
MSLPELKYPVHERFRTWQGEGVHMGRSAFFIRLFGCPVKCPWCDSAGTWHKGYVPKHVDKFTSKQLVEEVCAVEPVPEFVVITGGEPTIHNLEPLTEALSCADIPVHLETSGAFPIRGQFRWITLSPKRWKMPLEESIQVADEFKVIVEREEDIDFYTKVIAEAFAPSPIPAAIWLHPEWSQRENPAVLSAICRAVTERKGPFRAGWQLHKLYKVDLLDSRSRPAVPLGGDPKRGY